MIELNFYPLFGLVLGADYFNDEMENVQVFDDKIHTITLYLLVIGIQFRWATNRE